mmetsp:Transcript_44957/g.43533  ORF Transcript_44957/g.43533 Transcript_44957/m.43533 type:complete len:96 (-) Transcript_44957:128-415(-)
MGKSGQDNVDISEYLNGDLMKRYSRLALENQIWLSLGGFPEKCDEKENKRYNTHVLIDSEGSIVQSYRKLHLFDVDLTNKGGLSFKESTYIEAGD